jgi:molecular chaperone IbpA
MEDMAMRTLDLNWLWRSSVGFDRLIDLIDETTRWTGDDGNYPPYNIERTDEDHYQISLALAGFTPEEVSITAEQNVLVVEGRKSERGEANIFTREFQHAPSAVCRQRLEPWARGAC